MKKKYLLLLAVLGAVLIATSFASAVCCEKLKSNGLWCQPAANKEQCDSGYSFTNTKTCDEVPECHGTCVNENTGECSENTRKAQCELSGGKWHEEPLDEIDQCKEGCCIMGEDAYFINPTECGYLFRKYDVQGLFDSSVTSRESCAEMRSNIKTGACVISTLSEKACTIETELDCSVNKIQELAEKLKNPSLNQDIKIKFYDGYLCTASINGVKISDCATSENTECKNSKVYYKDTCGNFANIYDKDKYGDNAESVEYWTYIKSPYKPEDKVCPIVNILQGSSSCGNCDPTENTVCQSYKDAGLPQPAKNKGGYVCGDLSCKVDMNGDGTKETTKKHGESWCSVETATKNPGTFVITQDLESGEIAKADRTALKNASKYNIPGSRYYKSICAFGEVLVEECKDYRNSVCTEGKNENGYSQATCVFNNWRTCPELETKTACEDATSFCKWISGYRWDELIVSESERKEKQGSCVPLVAPGFDFWKATTKGNAICSGANVQESALFETNILTSRTKFSEWSDKAHANRCVNGCYALPGYANEFNQKPNEEKQYPGEITCGNTESATCSKYDILTEFYDESGFELENKVEDYYLSARRGQYCHKDGKPDQWLTGKVRGPNYDCTAIFEGAKDERKERDYPIYLTHDEWIKSITERARSLGDCGYKQNINGEYSAPETEIVTAIFQKLSQKLDVKKNISAEQVIYKGGVPVKGTLYTTDLPYEIKTYSCASDYNGMCTSTVNNENPCGGEEVGEINSEASCPTNMVCCVYPE